MSNRLTTGGTFVSGGLRGIVLAGSHEHKDSGFDVLLPRPLVPVAQMPLLWYALRWLCDEAVSTTTVCVNSAARAVRDSVPQVSSMRIEYLEDWTPRGPAGCARDAAVQGTDASTFVVVDGTTVPLVSLAGLLDTHRSSGALATVVAHRDPRHPDAAERGLRPSGVYVFARRALEQVPATGFHDIKEELLPRLFRAGERVAVHVADDASPRVVDAESYMALNDWMVEHVCRQAAVPREHRRLEQALVHESACVDPGARLIGPVILGPRVTVAAGAVIIGPTSVGSWSKIEENATISRSVFWRDSRVGSRALVDRSLLADGAAIEAGASVSGVLKVPQRQRGHSIQHAHRDSRLVPAWLGGRVRHASSV